jgi:hypothetical protein
MGGRAPANSTMAPPPFPLLSSTIFSLSPEIRPPNTTFGRVTTKLVTFFPHSAEARAILGFSSSSSSLPKLDVKQDLKIDSCERSKYLGFCLF